jgi:hypothetical protein
MSKTIIMPKARLGLRRKHRAESLSAEMAALSRRPRVELPEDFDGGRSAKALEHEKLRRAIHKDEESLMWFEIGRLDEAEQCCREAVALFEELDGSEHPDGANALKRLSSILSAQWRYREDEACAVRAAGIMAREGEQNRRKPNDRYGTLYIER